MIDKLYIDGAIKIRKEFLKLNNELLSYEKDLLQLIQNLNGGIMLQLGRLIKQN